MGVKGAQLGMPFSTAFYRLMRDIIFALAVETGKNLCFRCNQPMTRDDFSIEHKKPWLHVSADLFWSLENIAFSHKRCNSENTRKGNRRPFHKRTVGPEGTSWCTGHKDFLPVTSFQKNRAVWNGLQRQCKVCRKNR